MLKPIRTHSTLVVNDVHAQISSTEVSYVAYPDSLENLCSIIKTTSALGRKLSVCGTRHSMGGQQFCTDEVLLDTTRLNRVISFDNELGLIEVESGMTWVDLLAALRLLQPTTPHPWTFAQKQTGADRLSLGGAVASNIHGRGLTMGPFINDVESLKVVTAEGAIVCCSREENGELFGLVFGGYGLFGIVYSITLRLVPLMTTKRISCLTNSAELMHLFEERISMGCLYGDFQFSIDPASPGFLREGICSCHQSVSLGAPPATIRRKVISESEWEQLVYLAHCKKDLAYKVYSEHYLSTNNQLYAADEQQFSPYLEGYHKRLDAKMLRTTPASELLSELYVPREALHEFLCESARYLRSIRADVIYGTVRLINQEEQSFLRWASSNYACIVFNLHTEHTQQGIHQTRIAFRGLIERALSFGGSFYLTYHRFATSQQLLKAYPRLPDFLKAKQTNNPQGIFGSDWYLSMLTALRECRPIQPD